MICIQTIHEMNYKDEFDRVLLAKGRYEGVEVVIISFGYYPAAYIDCQSLVEKLGKTIPIKKIRCHGGKPSYDGNRLIMTNEIQSDKHWFGWDYGHTGDYCGLCEGRGGHKWTTAEIMADVEKVIDRLIERARDK